VLVRIEVRGIEWVINLRHPRSRDLLLQQHLRGHHAEPGVFANVHVRPRQTTKTIRLPADDEALDEVLCDLVHHRTRREGILDLHDALEEADLVRPVGVEGRAPDEHFVNQDPEGPVIDALIVTLGQDNFRREVFRRATKSVGLVHDDLSESQINEDAIPKGVNQNVLGFQIAVGDVPVVKVGQRLEDAGGVETRVRVGDAVARLGVNDREELTPLHQIEEHVEVLIVLKGGYQSNDERVIDGRHYVLLPDHPLHLVMSNDLPLIQHFERVRLAGLLVTREPHLTERAHSQYAEFHEVFKIDRSIDFRSLGLHSFPESGNVTDNALDCALRQHAALRFLQGGDCLMTDRFDSPNRLIPHVIPRTQDDDNAIAIVDTYLTLPNDEEILPRQLSLLCQ